MDIDSLEAEHPQLPPLICHPLSWQDNPHLGHGASGSDLSFHSTGKAAPSCSWRTALCNPVVALEYTLLIHNVLGLPYLLVKGGLANSLSHAEFVASKC